MKSYLLGCSKKASFFTLLLTENIDCAIIKNRSFNVNIDCFFERVKSE